MSDRRKNSLQGYQSTPSPTPPVETAPQLLKNYPGAETFKGSQKGSMLRLVDRKGNFHAYNLSHIIEASYQDGIFTIVTTSRIFVLTGKNLIKIADMMDERKLKALHEFNPTKHAQPKDEKAVLVEEITVRE